LQTPPQTEAKQVQATAAPVAPVEAHKEVVPTPPTQQQITQSVEDALRLISPIFLILPSAFTLMGINPSFKEHSHLSLPDLTLLQQFYFSITMNVQDLTVEAKLKRAQDELLKVIHSASDDSIYGQVRRLLTEGIVKNKDVLSQNPTFPIVQHNLLLQGVPMVAPQGFPNAQAFAQMPLAIPPQYIQQRV